MAQSASRGTGRWLAGLVGVALLASGVSGCEVLGERSKVRAGQLYATGEATFDTYFNEVHAEQVASSAWPDERKTSRKPLTDVLKMTPDSSDQTIAQATKDRLSTGTLRLEVEGSDAHIVPASSTKIEEASHDVLDAVEQTAHHELERSKKLHDLDGKLEALYKSGHELEPHIADDFSKQGQRAFEVKQELHASYDVLTAIAGSARREAKAAEDFVADLSRAVSTGTEQPAVARDRPARPGKADRPKEDKPPKADKPADKPDKPDKADKPDKPPKPAKPPKAPAVAHTDSPPPPKPTHEPPKPPPPKPPEEVFNP